LDELEERGLNISKSNKESKDKLVFILSI